MTDASENTLTKYLGQEFQFGLIWQILVEPEFAEKIIPSLAIEYFDDPNVKRLFIIILEYLKEFEKVPNLQNESILMAIHKYKTQGNTIEEELLLGIIERLNLWNEKILNGSMLHNGQEIQKETNTFVKQQEYRKLGEFILDNVRSGDIKKKTMMGTLEEKILKISRIGDAENTGTSVIEGIDHALRKEFRETIPTGVTVIDELTGGGLGKGEIGLILTPSGVGKAQPLSSKILTPNGWITMGDIGVGDLVIGSDGKQQGVLAVYPQGEREIYRIDFSDDTHVLCDKEHLWTVNSFNQRQRRTYKSRKTVFSPDNSYKTITTLEISKNIKIKQNFNYRMPNIMPVLFNDKNVQIDSYVMGVLLGDGCMSKSNNPCNITTSDVFILNKIMNRYVNTSHREFVGRKLNYKTLHKISLLGSKKYLTDLELFGCLSHNKFIPDCYLYNSLDKRIELLQGLIDSDGYIMKNGTIIYTTISEVLSKNIRELVLSLGGTARIRKSQKQYKNKYNEKVNGKVSFDITISFPNNGVIPCSLPRKLERVRYREKYKNNKYISNVSFSHVEKAQCIYVENADHLYVTDDYVLTHNTTALTKIANTGYEHGKNVLQIIFEDTEDQIKRKHYCIWSKIALSEMDDNRDLVSQIVHEKVKVLEKNGGRLIVIKFSQEDTTMLTIKNWMIGYEKKMGFKFDELVLDYLDCLESHKKVNDRNEAELVIVKSLLALAADFNIPCWSALQGNRGSFDAKFLDVKEMGGNIKRVQKSHFFMSVAKPDNMKDTKLANVKIIKARFAKDGQLFKDSTFDNDYLDIRLNDEDYGYMYSKDIPKVSQKKLDRVNSAKANITNQSDPTLLIDPLLADMEGKYARQSLTIKYDESDLMPDDPLDNINKPSSSYLPIYQHISNAASTVMPIEDIVPDLVNTPEVLKELQDKLNEAESLEKETLNWQATSYPNGEVITTTTTTQAPTIKNKKRPPKQEKKVTPEKIAIIIKMTADGHKPEEIADVIDVTKQTVYSYKRANKDKTTPEIVEDEGPPIIGHYNISAVFSEEQSKDDVILEEPEKNIIPDETNCHVINEQLIPAKLIENNTSEFRENIHEIEQTFDDPDDI